MTLPKRFKFLYDSSLSDLSNLSLAVNKTDSRRSIYNALKTLVNPDEYDPNDFKEILGSLVSVASKTDEKSQQNERDFTKIGGKSFWIENWNINLYEISLSKVTR